MTLFVKLKGTATIAKLRADKVVELAESGDLHATDVAGTVLGKFKYKSVEAWWIDPTPAAKDRLSEVIGAMRAGPIERAQ